jgi:hypothetical protein
MVLYSLLEEAGCAGLVPDMKTLLESDTSNRLLRGGFVDLHRGITGITLLMPHKPICAHSKEEWVHLSCRGENFTTK